MTDPINRKNPNGTAEPRDGVLAQGAHSQGAFAVANDVHVRAEGGAAQVAAVAAERLSRLWGVAVGTQEDAPHENRATVRTPGVVLRLTEDLADFADFADFADEAVHHDVVGRRGTPFRHADGGGERLREVYRLDVAERDATVTALDLPGLLHGVTALGQLAHDGRVATGTVLDGPRFSWRGLSVDIARHPLPLPDLLRLVDVLTDLRLNVLHLHLTDDQGWRLQVPSRPLLTELSGGTAVDDDPGGFLTTEDWAVLVDRAHALGVTVVPEIDLPGHVNAALHAYGELTPSGKPVEPYTGIDVGFSRLYADLPATAPFLHDVLGDVARATPGQYVHIGGDEVFTMDGEEYARLVRTAADAVEAQDRTVVAWQEAAAAPLTPGTVLQVWDMRENTTNVVRAAAAGARVLLSPGNRAYMDMMYDADCPLGRDWAGYLSLRRARCWAPEDVVPGLDLAHVAGVEAAMWTETTRDLDEVTWMLLPRLAAIAEVAWGGPGADLSAANTTDSRRSAGDEEDDDRAWKAFLDRVRRQGQVWDGAGLRWNRDALDD